LSMAISLMARLAMSGEELPPLVLSLSKDTSGGRALETMSVYFLNNHQAAVLERILG